MFLISKTVNSLILLRSILPPGELPPDVDNLHSAPWAERLYQPVRSDWTLLAGGGGCWTWLVPAALTKCLLGKKLEWSHRGGVSTHSVLLGGGGAHRSVSDLDPWRRTGSSTEENKPTSLNDRLHQCSCHTLASQPYGLTGPAHKPGDVAIPSKSTGGWCRKRATIWSLLQVCVH